MQIVSQPKNSPQLWDKIWARTPSRFPGSQTLESLYRRLVYFSAFDALLRSFSLANQSILELGSGTGANSAYLAQRHGAQSVTLLDFSEGALERVAIKRFLCPVTKIQGDLLEFTPKQQYDFVHSTGLIEHFVGAQRQKVVGVHAACVRRGGLVMIWVPVHSPAFAVIGTLNRLIGIEEIPLTEKELRSLCLQNGLEIIRENHSALGAMYGVLARKV